MPRKACAVPVLEIVIIINTFGVTERRANEKREQTVISHAWDT